MKITKVETILLSAPGDLDPFMQARKMRSAAIIEIHTDGGLIGIGETFAGYCVPEIVPHVVDFYKPVLIGANPENVSTLFRHMFHAGQIWGRVGLGAMVLSGLETALWDLNGKMNNVPVYKLLGGPCHERLLCYATGGVSPWPEDQLIKKLEYYRNLHFRTSKVAVGWWEGITQKNPPRSIEEAIDQETAKLQYVKEHFKDDFQLMLDCHMDNLPEGTFQWDEEIAQRVLRALEPFCVPFFEEPLPYTDPQAYARLRRSTTQLVAGGEGLITAAEFRQWIDADALGLPQLDASCMGGIMEFIKVAKLCEVKGLPIATHSWAAAPGVAANLHAAFASPNVRILEFPPYNSPLHTELWVEPPMVKDGYLHLSDTPGLGVKITDDIKNRYPFQPGTGEFNSVPGKKLIT